MLNHDLEMLLEQAHLLFRIHLVSSFQLHAQRLGELVGKTDHVHVLLERRLTVLLRSGQELVKSFVRVRLDLSEEVVHAQSPFTCI
jgi:hypothetical protein